MTICRRKESKTSMELGNTLPCNSNETRYINSTPLAFNMAITSQVKGLQDVDTIAGSTNIADD